LECPLTSNIKKIKKVGPNLKANPGCIDGIKNGNINVFTLANNHIMDYGAEGLMETIKLCDEKGILTVGAG
jgi:poly-gamma-glutamate synthesis protein (capsule biosynthesis protein)